MQVRQCLLNSNTLPLKTIKSPGFSLPIGIYALAPAGQMRLTVPLMEEVSVRVSEASALSGRALIETLTHPQNMTQKRQGE